MTRVLVFWSKQTIYGYKFFGVFFNPLCSVARNKTRQFTKCYFLQHAAAVSATWKNSISQLSKLLNTNWWFSNPRIFFATQFVTILPIQDAIKKVVVVVNRQMRSVPSALFKFGCFLLLLESWIKSLIKIILFNVKWNNCCFCHFLSTCWETIPSN
jgi:hypothetical protein